MTNFDYKKYSLENLENWIHDAMSAGEATPQEIYDTIIGVVKDNYECYKKQADQAYELLNLLNANPFNEEVKALGELWNKEDVLKEREYYEGSDSITFSSCSADDAITEGMTPWSDFWSTDNCSTVNFSTSGDVIDFSNISNAESEKYREYNLREAEYYDKRAKLDMNSTYDDMIAAGYMMTNDGLWVKVEEQEDTILKWRLPVEIDSVSGDYYFTLPEDLLQRTGWKENDELKWVDNGDGSFTLVKHTEPLGMDEC